MRLHRKASPAILCAAFLAGCGLGEGGDSFADDESVARADLAIMVLSREELGMDVGGLEIDAEDSGPVSASEAAADATIDPEDDASLLRRVGWVGGYELNYSDPKGKALKRGRGLLVAGSSVYLFEDEGAASARLQDEMLDFERLQGKTVEGVRLTRFETFEVDVGDEAKGIEVTFRVGGESLHATGVFFRRGRLLADVGVGRVDDVSARADVEQAASALEARIQGVLAGEIRDDPVPLPRQARKKDEKQAGASGSPDPKPLTLRADAFPAGTSVTGEAYKRQGDTRSFLREFDLPGDRLGGSRVLYLRAMTQIVSNSASAANFVEFASTVDGARDLAETFARSALKIRPKNMLPGPLPVRGARAAALIASFDAPRGRVAVAMVFVHQGRAIGSVTAMGMSNELDPSDVIAFADELRARLRT
jgi:hypothetical protein